MTRIVAGRWGGRRIRVAAAGVRPTSERVREAVFNHLAHRTGGFDGLAVLDVYAGSGALGLEAGSRGAGSLCFIERDRQVAGLLRRTIADLGAEQATVIVGDAGAVARRTPPRSFDVILADPPYAVDRDELAGVVAELVSGGWAAPACLLVVETTARGADFHWPAGTTGLDSRRYGDTRVWYGRVSPTGTE